MWVGAHLDGLAEETFSQDFSVDEVTRAEDAVRAAAGRAQGLGPSDVPRDQRHLFGVGVGAGRLADAVAASERGKQCQRLEGRGRGAGGDKGAALLYLKDLLFRVLSSATSVRSRTALDGEERRMREVAGTPSGVLGELSRRPSIHCLTGSYSMSSCRVWLVQWIRSST